MNDENFERLLAEILRQFAIPSAGEIEQFLDKLKGGDRPQ